MPKKYSITFELNDSQARAAFARGTKAMGAFEAASTKALNAAEAALAKSGQAVASVQANMTRAATVGATKRKKLADDEAAHIDVGLHKLQVAGVRFQEQLTRGTQRESDKRRRLLDAEARYQESSALGPNGRLAQVKRRALTEEELQVAARNRFWDVHHKKRVDQILKEQYATRDSFAEAIANATGLGQAMTAAGATLLGFEEGKKLLAEVAGVFMDVKKSASSMANDVLATLGSLRDIAALRDKAAPDMSDVERHHQIRDASGLKKEEAIELEDRLGNVMGTVSKDKMGEAEREKLTVGMARMAARRGGGPAIVPLAQMAGVVTDMIKPDAQGKVSSDRVLQMMDALDEINKKSTAPPAIAAAQSMKLITSLANPEVVGMFDDPRKAAALNTVASKFAPEDSAEATLQASRAARGFTKWRQGKGMSASQAKTLQEAGITEQMDPAQSMRQLFKYAKKNMGQGEAFDAFLARHGFRNDTGNTRLGQFYGEYLSGNFDRNMKEAESPLSDEYKGKDRAWEQSEVGRGMIEDARKDHALSRQGEKTVELELAKKAAGTDMAEKGRQTSKMASLEDRITGVFMGFAGPDAGREAVTEREAIRLARKKAGLTPGSGLGTFGTWMERINSLPIPLNPYSMIPGAARMLGTATSGVFEDRSEEARQLRYLQQIAEATARTANQNAPTPPPIPVTAPSSTPLR